MARLELFFLGPLEIHSDGRLLTNPPTLKSQSLLAYLICHRSQPQPRNRLAGLFWGELPERKAHRCLSTALWHIRRCLPDDSVLLNDAHSVQFDTHSNSWLDKEAFEAMAYRSDPAGLQAAVALYRGDFLDGFYDDWILSERYRLEALFFDSLARLMAHHETAGDYQAALAVALRLLGHDGLREDAHRQIMRAYCRLGQRKAALEQYDRCRQILLDELAIQPTDETNSLYQAILEGRFEIGPLPEISQVTISPVMPAGRSPLDLAAQVRLVGREPEMAFLEDCWQQARARRGSLALIAGEVGVGKTRLVEEFARRIHWQGGRYLRGRCYEFERLIPYQPIAEALQTALPTFLESELTGLPEWVLRETARLAPEVPGLPAANDGHPVHRRISAKDSEPEQAALPGVDPQQARLFAGVTRVIAELSAQSALLIILEDLHWASESTLQMLHHLVRHLASHPVLFVGTFRPEDISLQHPLPDLHRHLAHDGLAHALDLPRLTHAAVTTLVQEMSGAGEAVDPLAARLFHETEGNPFFLMELIKSLFETGIILLNEGAWQGDFRLASEAKPSLTASLSETVQARVRRLSENAQIALDQAAVIGREFDFEPFNLAWGKGEEDTFEALDELLRHRLIEEQLGPDERDYRFTHHKIQEVIYQSLPRQRRYHLHARAGAALEKFYVAEVKTRAGELAFHFEQACQQDKSFSSKAIGYLLQAGTQAVRGSDNQQAVAYYQRGLDILHSQPESEARMQQEVELLMTLAGPVSILKGYASPEIKRIYGQAYDLCQKLGEMPELFASLVGIARYYGLTGDFETGGKLIEQLLTIARVAQENDFLVETYRQKGAFLFSLGRLTEAREFWEQGLVLYDRSRHEHYTAHFGHDPAVTCLGFLGITLWLLGYPDQACIRTQELCNLIASMTHPSSLAYACSHLAVQAYLRHDAKLASEHAEAAIQLSLQHGLTSWRLMATVLKGWAQFETGQITEGLALMEEGTQAFQDIGFAHFTPFFLALRAEACLKAQELDRGLTVIAAAMAIGQHGGDRFWTAELHRLHGELLRAAGEEDRIVAAYFQQALETARQQGARMLELRAAMSLARLQPKNNQSLAWQALAEIYEWFSEGFDSRDLQKANDLLTRGVTNVTYSE